MGILTNDGRGCGSRKKFQSLMGSCENLVAKILVANGLLQKLGHENFSREWMWSH